MKYFMPFKVTLTLVILPHIHSCHNHSCQTHSCHTLVALVKLILVIPYTLILILILTITYSHCFFNLKITLKTPYIYTFVTLRIQEMKTTHTYI